MLGTRVISSSWTNSIPRSAAKVATPHNFKSHSQSHPPGACGLRWDSTLHDHQLHTLSMPESCCANIGLCFDTDAYSPRFFTCKLIASMPLCLFPLSAKKMSERKKTSRFPPFSLGHSLLKTPPGIREGVFGAPVEAKHHETNPKFQAEREQLLGRRSLELRGEPEGGAKRPPRPD